MINKVTDQLEGVYQPFKDVPNQFQAHVKDRVEDVLNSNMIGQAKDIIQNTIKDRLPQSINDKVKRVVHSTDNLNKKAKLIVHRRKKASHKVIGKTIWITGASGGIGKALAIELAERGAIVILSARSTDKLQAVKDSLKDTDKHLVLPCDILNFNEVNSPYKMALAHTGKIDWLINNAGVSQRSLIMDTTEAVERQIMEINYFAQTRLTMMVLPEMIQQGGGKVVMISSVAGLIGSPYRGAYGGAKAALHMWANSLRAELHDQRIQVATVFPGYVQTDVSINALTGDGRVQGTMDEATQNGLSSTFFAKATVDALKKGEEHIIVAGKKERIAIQLMRLSPPKLYKVIRQFKVK